MVAHGGKQNSQSGSLNFETARLYNELERQLKELPSARQRELLRRLRKEEHMQMAERLRAAIEKSGKSPYRLAKDSGVSLPIITRFIKRERDIRLETAGQLADTLGLDLVERKRRPAKSK